MTRILNGKECKALLADFRTAYEALEHGFVELGEKAARIREQEAYGETCSTFDEWIRAEHYARSVVYDAMKAARFFRLTSPVAEPLKIVLDRESHFREFPADATESQAKKIIKRLEQLVEPDADGARHPTARHVKAAVAAVCPRPAETSPKQRWEEADRQRLAAATAGDETKPAPDEPPRPAPESITAEYHDVKIPPCLWNGKPQIWAEDLQAFRSEVATKFQPLFQKHGHDKDFLLAATTVFRNWSEEVAHRQPTRRAK